VDWSLAEKNRSTIDFVQTLTSLRKLYPVLRRNRFLTGAYNEELGVKDVTWIHPSGTEMNDATWRDAGLRCVGMLIDGRAQASGVRERGSDATLLLIFNGSAEAVKFKLPQPVDGKGWKLQLDTDGLSAVAGDRQFPPLEEVQMADRSVSVFLMY
jgi:glycogen operon protein